MLNLIVLLVILAVLIAVAQATADIETTPHEEEKQLLLPAGKEQLCLPLMGRKAQLCLTLPRREEKQLLLAAHAAAWELPPLPPLTLAEHCSVQWGERAVYNAAWEERKEYDEYAARAFRLEQEARLQLCLDLCRTEVKKLGIFMT